MTAFSLRLIALISMLVDHTYVALLPEQTWMNCIGRLAFPIFAFQLTEGYRHTKDKKKYATRLFLFALLSEIPFDLAAYGEPFFWDHQNIFWTLLIGLLLIWAVDRVFTRWQDSSIRFTAILFIVIASLYVAVCLRVDYSLFGVLTIFAFYILRSKSRITLTLCVLVLNALMGSYRISVFGIRFPIQLIATLSMIPICLYDGKQGCHSKAWSWFCYAFYPLHLLILSLLRLF